jgi:hypothetical protein
MNNHLSLQFIDHKKTTTYDVGNPSLYLGQLNNNNVSGRDAQLVMNRQNQSTTGKL